MLNVQDLTGLWRRGFISWPDGRRDETTHVTWLQAATFYADLRQPPWPAGSFGASCLHRLSMAECEMLTTQQGFAGVLKQRDTAFEWVRIIDFQPPQPLRDIGLLFWQDDVLVEEGVETEYLEHWHRDQAIPKILCAALHLWEDGRFACLLRVGDRFMFARDRQVSVDGKTLAEAVAGAASLRAAQLLLDFEISLGTIEGGHWRITRSSLPYRIGAEFRAAGQNDTHLDIADISPQGEPASRRWEITAAAGDTSVLLNANLEKF